MSMTKNNRQGAGDGIVVQAPPPMARKRRLQVSSARKFATRGVVPNPKLQEKLATALGEYHRSSAPLPTTPPPMALKRRSLSMAEIACVKDSHEQNAGERRVAPTAYLEARAAAADDAERRRVDAARRVCHQLLLNAWRRRRAELASLVESRDRIEAQAEQMQLQVDALQDLRSFEADRRRETNERNKELSAQLDEMMHNNLLIKQREQNLEDKLKTSELAAIKCHETFMNERNSKITLQTELDKKNQQIILEKERIHSLTDEVQQLTRQILKLENEKIKHHEEIDRFEDTIMESEEKYKNVVSDCNRLQNDVFNALCKNNELIEENHSLEERITAGRKKIDKLESKVIEIKRQAGACNKLKLRTQEENDELRFVIDSLQNDFRALKERQWWLKTGEFLFEKFAFCAYLVFPALPREGRER